jgi:glycine betaine/proline transport system substrate-binding protein
LTKGFGCRVEIRRGTVLPLVRDLANGDVDILMELWTANPPETWGRDEANGKVVRAGTNYADAVQGWFVPAYVAKGRDAPARGLRSVEDLARYKQLFPDPEYPGKARFHNCPVGWECELVNSKKLKAYRLNKEFVNFRPSSGAAFDDAVSNAVGAQRAILFYYWGPTWLVRKFDLMMLREPPFNKRTWLKMLNSKRPVKGTAYPSSDVVIAANAKFAGRAPAIMKFLKSWRSSNAIVSDALMYMHDRNVSAEEAAAYFMKTKAEIWTRWVPKDVARRIQETL